MSLVTPYDSAWPTAYAHILDYLLSGLQTYISIEHFGSTSIPGMVAKPIIDIMIVVPGGQMHQAITELAALGYQHQGDLGIAGREAYHNLPSHIDLPKHHLYTCYADYHQLVGLRAFREFLRVHESWRRKLSDLKLELASAPHADRQTYMDGKRTLVEDIIAMATQERPWLASQGDHRTDDRSRVKHAK